MHKEKFSKADPTIICQIRSGPCGCDGWRWNLQWYALCRGYHTSPGSFWVEVDNCRSFLYIPYTHTQCLPRFAVFDIPRTFYSSFWFTDSIFDIQIVHWRCHCKIYILNCDWSSLSCVFFFYHLKQTWAVQLILMHSWLKRRRVCVACHENSKASVSDAALHLHRNKP